MLRSFPARIAGVPPLVARRAKEALHRRGVVRAPVYVMGFPKSGGTWVRRLLADLVDEHDKGQGRSSGPVIHDHWTYAPALRPAVYVLRDGRDVVVSLYFHHLRDIQRQSARAPHEHAYLQRVLGPGYDLQDVGGNLPAFIRSLAEHPFGGILRGSGNRRFLPWPRHVADWSGRLGVRVVRYETLLADTAGELGSIADWLGADVSAAQIAEIAERHSFQSLTGRSPGDADPTAFVRKGIAGDWRNYFTPTSAAAFDAYAGDALIALGYEPDRDWLTPYP
jgi:hypothetical protein